MKRVKNIVIGGIQNKIVNLILITVILLTAANIAVSLYHNKMLSEVVGESSVAQEEAIKSITSTAIEDAVLQSLKRTNTTEAYITEEMFEGAKRRVLYLASCAQKLLASPDDFPPRAYGEAEPGDDGTWKAIAIYADGVEASDPQVREKLGLIANLSDLMINLCPAYEAANCYIGLPEGVQFYVSDKTSSWIENGKVKSYDPRTRLWYQTADETGGLIFTDGEIDAATGVYCIECAAPVYYPDGSLGAVIGTDLFLDDIRSTMEESMSAGEYQLLINQNGRAVFEHQEEIFPMNPEDAGQDIRSSQLELLSSVAADALQGKNVEVTKGDLADGAYYITASPIRTTGWVLISAYSEEMAGQITRALETRIGEIQDQATAAYEAKRKYSYRTAIALLIAVAALMLAMAIIVGTRIVKPLNTITKRIASLGEGNMEFKMEDAYRTGDEVEELAQSFANLSHKTVHYLDTVKRVTAEKERISAELSLATEIQAAMLPHIVPAFPDRKDFDIYGSMDPAKEVGGDFYDYFLIDDDHLGMVMADVSGKGVPAALLMMASKIILQSIAMLGKQPAEILEKTNEAICSNNEAQMFVTVWMGILELSTGTLTAANAGHEYPALKNPGEQFKVYKDKHGFVIGGLDGVTYKPYEIHLAPGSKLFVYTDGVPEATNAQNELFGTKRMIEALNTDPDGTPEEILQTVRNAVDGFVKSAEQFDDLTMLCLEYKGHQDTTIAVSR